MQVCESAGPCSTLILESFVSVQVEGATASNAMWSGCGAVWWRVWRVDVVVLVWAARGKLSWAATS